MVIVWGPLEGNSVVTGADISQSTTRTEAELAHLLSFYLHVFVLVEASYIEGMQDLWQSFLNSIDSFQDLQ